MQTPVLILTALAAGALRAAQGPIFSRSALHAGGAVPAAILAFSVGLGALLAIGLLGGAGLPRPGGIAGMPAWIWSGGLIGTAVVLLTIHAVPRIGTASFVSAVVCGQLIAALFYDHVGAFGMTPRRIGWSEIAGAVLLLSGVFLIAGNRQG